MLQLRLLFTVINQDIKQDVGVFWTIYLMTTNRNKTQPHLGLLSWSKTFQGWGEGGYLYLGVSKSMGHAPKMWQFENWNLIENWFTRDTSCNVTIESRNYNEIPAQSVWHLIFTICFPKREGGASHPNPPLNPPLACTVGHFCYEVSHFIFFFKHLSGPES